MQRFSARLIKRGFAATAAAMPLDLVLTPVSWSATDRGGMKQCSVQAAGGAESLVYLCGWLGDDLEIHNEAGDLVWHGTLWDIEITLGNVLMRLTLDDVYNRVAVIYPFINPDGTVDSRTTAWVEDADSIARYGTRELLYGMPESFTRSAETVRDQLLERFRVASPVISTQGGGGALPFGATLTGMGAWQKAASVYFANPDGLVEHKDQSGSFLIGRYLTSNQISFGTATPGGDADEIHIATGNFDPLSADDQFTISGATNAANNGQFTISHQDASNQITISGSFVAEATGANVKISWGEGISYDNIAMSFETTTTWVCTHVAVKCRQVGSPSDSFRISLYPDSAGVPGTFLTYNETLGSALYTELNWTEFQFTTPVTLTAGNTYYVGIRRTGTASLNDGYEVALDEGLGYAGGAAIFMQNSAWETRSPDADMPFRVIGEIDSTEQIVKAIAAVSSFSGSLVEVDSNIPIRQFSDDQRTALDEMEEMLDAGMSTGERLVAQVLRDGTVLVGTAEAVAFGGTRMVLGADGKLRYGGGGFVSPGQLVFGQHIEMENLLLVDGVSVRASRGAGVYISSSEYDALTGTLSVESDGAIDPWRALTIKKG